jgi:alpha-tubulin suppressor-like RCC1 family protein
MGVVLKSGFIATWGQDNDGQLGSLDDSGASQPTPTLVASFDEVTDMAFLQYASCALRADGTVWCWGSTVYGETGSSANGGPVQYAPAEVQGLAHVTAITAGLNHVCALIADGTVDCWGWNTDGALGRATTAVFDPSPAPVEF